jgi:hypothetical protein
VLPGAGLQDHADQDGPSQQGAELTHLVPMSAFARTAALIVVISIPVK